MADKTKSVFDTLNEINVGDHTEKKNGLTYLSWAWAWAEVKKAYPDAEYKIYETPYGRIYFDDGRTCWVKTGVTINGLEHIEYLPVMDFKNKSITIDKIESTDVNKAIQRSLTKACARHGLGLYIYAGEDLPECEQTAEPPLETKAAAKAAPKAAAPKAAGVAEADLRAKVLKYCNRYTADQIKQIAARYNKATINDLTAEDCKDFIDQLVAAGKNIEEKTA